MALPGFAKTAPKAATPSKAAEKTPNPDKKPKVERLDFINSPAAKPLLDEKGRLKEKPGAAYDSKLHLAPKKSDFASETLYMHWRADELEQHAQDMVKRAAEMRQEADALVGQPDPAVRAQVKRLARLIEATKALEEALAKAGITLPKK